jgi:hypothetical protein
MLIVKDPEINMIPLEGGYPNCFPIALGGTALLVGRDSSELRGRDSYLHLRLYPERTTAILVLIS